MKDNSVKMTVFEYHMCYMDASVLSMKEWKAVNRQTKKRMKQLHYVHFKSHWRKNAAAAAVQQHGEHQHALSLSYFPGQ